MTLSRMIRATLFALAGFTVAAVVAEASLRLIAATPLWRVLPVVEVSLYGPDADAGYAHRPYVDGIWRSENRARVAINTQGFRGPVLAEPKPAGETRVIVVGDSFVEALQVEQAETFTALAEARLRAGGRDIRVANFGLAGATPAVQRERLATRVAALHPDVVVLMPALGDFFSAAAGDDSAYAAWVSAADGGLVLRHGFRDTGGYRFRTSQAGTAFYWLLDNVQLVGLLNNRKNAGLLPPSAAAGATLRDACAAATDDWQNFGTPAAEIGWQRAARYMQDAAALGHQHGFVPLLLLRGLTPEQDCAAAAALRLSVQARLAALAAANGMQLHDVGGLVAASLPPGAEVSHLRGFGAQIGRGHLNQQGHAVYAAILSGQLVPLLPR